jgi:hypothetical protein
MLSSRQQHIDCLVRQTSKLLWLLSPGALTQEEYHEYIDMESHSPSRSSCDVDL